jgi:hypothetical protein
MATPGNLKNAVGPNDKTNNNSKEANVAGADFMDLIPTVLSPLGVEGTDTLLICLVAMRVEGNKVWLDNLILTWIFTNIEQINSARLTDYWNHATGNDSIPSDMDRCLNGLIERADEIFNKFEKSRYVLHLNPHFLPLFTNLRDQRPWRRPNRYFQGYHSRAQGYPSRAQGCPSRAQGDTQR